MIDFYKCYSNGKIYFQIVRNEKNKNTSSYEDFLNKKIGKIININDKDTLKKNWYFQPNKKMIDVYELIEISNTIKYMNITQNCNID